MNIVNVDLFPYRVQNVNNFYFRNHPVQTPPNAPVFKKYWEEFQKCIIEGKWINDEGTWVYMPPKLFFYVNYCRIVDEHRNEIYPRLRDNEWIIFSYLMCCEGFSGFEGDEKYTCYNLVKTLEEGKEKLNAVQINKIPASAKLPGGKYKKYIDPWDYLTRHYLVEEKPDKPLGHPLYENPYSNALILTARSVGKSSCLFVGDFTHEFLTGGKKRMDENSNVNKRLLFGMGCANKPQLQRSMNNIKAFYDNMPGQYIFPDDRPAYMGPFYKRVQGGWDVGSEINHIVKKKNNTADIIGSSMQSVVLTADKTKIGAGDRFRRIYIEEVGFLQYTISVHAANKDSLQSGGRKVGMSIFLGTGGDIESIREPKQMFENPAAYDIFGIPNYWKNSDKKIGLFIPKTYALEDYKDPQGCTHLEMAFQSVLEQRDKDRKEMDSVSFQSEIMFNPLIPEELLRPSNSGLLPKQEAAEQLSKIESYDLFQKRAQIGKLLFNPMQECGVEWRKDMTLTLRPILEYQMADKKSDKEGAVIIYEQPPERIPEDLYWVLYDPAKQSGDAESFHSILVYKNFCYSDGKTLYDTIIAEWIGRKGTLEENYEMVIKFAKYFNAKIFPEMNVPGFGEWCKSKGYYDLLEADAEIVEREVLKNHKRGYYRKGVYISPRHKQWALPRLRDWLVSVKEVDAITGVPAVRTIDWILSPRILNEIIAYNDSENFDHISSLICLMFLRDKLGKEPVEIRDESEENPYAYIGLQHELMLEPTSKRCSFLNY